MSEIKGYPDTIQSIVEMFNKYDKLIKIDLLTRKSKEFKDHIRKYEYVKGPALKQGQLFLYEEFKYYSSDNITISYPKIGIFLHCYIVDMALGVEYINYRRSWENNIQFDYKYGSIKPIDDDISSEDYSQLKSVVRETIIWDDNLLVYGIWDNLPDFKILKEAYKNTWWFHKTIQEKREIKINSING